MGALPECGVLRTAKAFRRFDSIVGLAVEPNGSVRVCNSNDNSVRRVSSHGKVTRIAGNWEAGLADSVGDAAPSIYPNDVEGRWGCGGDAGNA